MSSTMGLHLAQVVDSPSSSKFYRLCFYALQLFNYFLTSRVILVRFFLIFLFYLLGISALSFLDCFRCSFLNLQKFTWPPIKCIFIFKKGQKIASWSLLSGLDLTHNWILQFFRLFVDDGRHKQFFIILIQITLSALH